MTKAWLKPLAMMPSDLRWCLTLLHSEWPTLNGVLAILNAIGLTKSCGLQSALKLLNLFYVCLKETACL